MDIAVLPGPQGVRRLRALWPYAVRLAVLVGLYRLYALARDLHGSTASPQSYEVAVEHARAVAGLTPLLPTEAALQEPLLGLPLLVKAFGAYYGSAHFLVTVGVVVWLAARRSGVFDRLASVLALSTFVGVAVFAVYPVAPPRLMPPGPLQTVDTLAVTGGLLSYDHGVLEKISDPLAALPSLHLAWAVWVALALMTARRRWVRALGWTHPVLTLAAVLVTGNHWYADAVAGAALVLVVAWAVDRAWPRAGQNPATAPAEPVTAVGQAGGSSSPAASASSASSLVACTTLSACSGGP